MLCCRWQRASCTARRRISSRRARAFRHAALYAWRPDDINGLIIVEGLARGGFEVYSKPELPPANRLATFGAVIARRIKLVWLSPAG